MPNSKKSKKNNTKVIFISSFIVTFAAAALLIGAVLKNFSPTVDVSIGQNDIQTEYSDGYAEIDDRLRWIQDEDNLTPTSEKYLQAEKNNILPDENSETSYENQETVPEPSDIVPEKRESIRPSNNIVHTPTVPPREEIPIPVNKIVTKAPVPKINEIQHDTPSQNIKTTKVYVGFYNSLDEAIIARKKISQTIPDIQPFVKAVNGQYIVQAGSFTDRIKAVELRDKLNIRGYDAKMLSD